MSEQNNKHADNVFPKGEVITNNYFTNTAYLKMLVTDAETIDCQVANVTFEAGARNNWHSHPGGQILLAISGDGYFQEKGQPIRLFKQGEAIAIKPDVLHWHGATPNGEFAHIAITTRAEKGETVWLEPVTDVEYNSYKE